MPGQFFYYEDENGERQDADIHEGILEDNPIADFLFQLGAIRQHVDEGNSLDEAIEMFGDEDVQEAYTNGKLTLELIDEALEVEE